MHWCRHIHSFARRTDGTYVLVPFVHTASCPFPPALYTYFNHLSLDTFTIEGFLPYPSRIIIYGNSFPLLWEAEFSPLKSCQDSFQPWRQVPWRSRTDLLSNLRQVTTSYLTLSICFCFHFFFKRYSIYVCSPDFAIFGKSGNDKNVLIFVFFDSMQSRLFSSRVTLLKQPRLRSFAIPRGRESGTVGPGLICVCITIHVSGC